MNQYNQQQKQNVEKWGVFEWVLSGPDKGNPFIDTLLRARFQLDQRVVEVNGFYDDDGIYRIRFMPDKTGEWQAVTHSNTPELDGQTTTFICREAAAGNHGPVVTDGRTGLRYTDGKLFSCIGTTAYAWIHQGDALAAETLNTLKDSPFDKIRMTVFPKSYRYNEHNDPDRFVFPVIKRGQTSWDGHWDSKGTGSDWEFDYSRFDVRFFVLLEKRIIQLMELGIEADLILFHPYDRWGHSQMPRDIDHRYLKYLIARLAAYRNVWWSLANEYDFLRSKTIEDWDAIGTLIAEQDPYHHLTGIHNGAEWFDHTRPWITHCSIQTSLFEFGQWQEAYGKPMVIDEMCYEGNIAEGWGNICAREMVHRFWDVAVQGGYPGHSEVYLTPEHVMWWNKGGQLRGESPARINFLRTILEQVPHEPITTCPDIIRGLACGQRSGHWIIGYTGVRQPVEITASLPVGSHYRLHHIDTWNMTITEAETIQSGSEGSVRVPLTGKPYMAFILKALDE